MRIEKKAPPYSSQALLQQNEPSDRESSAPSPRGVSSEKGVSIESYGTTYSDFAQVVDKLGASIEKQASQNPVPEGASSDVIPRVRVGLFTTDINRTFDVFGRCGVGSAVVVLGDAPFGSEKIVSSGAHGVV